MENNEEIHRLRQENMILKKRLDNTLNCIKSYIVVYSDGTYGIPFPLDVDDITKLLDCIQGVDENEKEKRRHF